LPTSFVCVDADRILNSLNKWFKVVLTREYRIGHKYNYRLLEGLYGSDRDILFPILT
jgi:hypothetical protein